MKWNAYVQDGSMIDGCFTVEGVGRGGGLALLWMTKANIEVLSFSKYHINVKMEDENEGYAWRFTGFYGDPNTKKASKVLGNAS